MGSKSASCSAKSPIANYGESSRVPGLGRDTHTHTHTHTRARARARAGSCLELAQHHRGRAVVLGRPQLVHRRLVDGLASLPVLGHPAQSAELVRPVLHELRRLLDRVPLDAADAYGNRGSEEGRRGPCLASPGRSRGYAADVPLVHLGEHVLQRVPALVEERLHLLTAARVKRRRPHAVHTRTRGRASPRGKSSSSA